MIRPQWRTNASTIIHVHIIVVHDEPKYFMRCPPLLAKFICSFLDNNRLYPLLFNVLVHKRILFDALVLQWGQIKTRKLCIYLPPVLYKKNTDPVIVYFCPQLQYTLCIKLILQDSCVRIPLVIFVLRRGTNSMLSMCIYMYNVYIYKYIIL